MREIDRISDSRRMKQAVAPPPPSEPDDMEEMLEFPLHEPLNTTQSVFDKNAFNKTGGINTVKSVFDRKAVFKFDGHNHDGNS
ncbi:MAG: hypothetical protein FWG83_05305 [Oscillospiraceae bacterium]|nr:hypothetical protein [Oscillospiraceae bacterium]